ncbi:site-specific integrase [uncultured Roseovarius sp.]|uniref:tyrosine-type recombinase/integrase n=1 Tax=uncultured Roseovarius sp. TaxID=293344 RepID=UPI002624904E|nr:site-specific integrase [uncultured Roseovarius sp.]
MKTRLTDLAIKKLALPPQGQVTHWDQTTPGFGIRCSTKSKSYVVMYGDKRQLKTLGRYPHLALSDARKQAKLFQATHVQPHRQPIEYDYETVVVEYLKDCHQRLRGSTLKGYELYLGHINFEGPISKVTQGDVLKAIEKYTSSPSSQNYAFTTFKVFFNWAVRRQYLAANPLNALKRPNKSAVRNRFLSDEELLVLLTYTLNNRDRFNNVVSLLALTGQRKGEISGLQWQEINDDQLVLSAERTKNKREHTVPLGQQALDLLHSIAGGSCFVFGTVDDDTPFNGWSRAQRRIIKQTGLNHFTLHDLRRTFSTIHAKLGTPIHVTEKLLNHVSGTISGVAAVYNRHSYMEEMRAAMDAYDEYLAKLLSDC